MLTVRSPVFHRTVEHSWRIIVFGIVLLVLACPAIGSEVYTWTGDNGVWSNVDCWSPSGCPDSIDEAALVPATVTVDLDLSPSVDWLNIENTATILDMNSWTLSTESGFTNAGLVKVYDGTATILGPLTNLGSGDIRIEGSNFGLTIGGPTLVNHGEIVVNYDRYYTAYLSCLGDVALSGTGSILLNDDGDDARLETVPGFTLTQAIGHTIHGRGQINAALDNAGLVLADVAGATLELRTEPKFNVGAMQSSSGANLNIIGTTVTQIEPGEILADAANVRLRDGAAVFGGTLSSLNGGAIYSDSGANTLEDVTLSGASWLGVNGSTGPLNLMGTFFWNDGALVVNWNQYYTAILNVGSDLTVQGMGQIILNDDGEDAQLNTAEGVTLTNAGDHTILGFGQINAALLNEGVISADVSGKALELRTHNKSNNALIKAEGGYLDLYGFTLTQSPEAQLLAVGEGSRVRLRGGATVVGGALASLTDGALYSDLGANTLQNVTLGSGSWLGLAGSTGPLNLVGDTFTNDGSVVINHNQYYGCAVSVNANLTAQGSGKIILNDDSDDAQLNTTSGATLTNAAGHTISGFGQVNAALVNHGDVIADVAGKALELRTEAKTNSGLMKAGGGYLDLYGFNLDQTSDGRLVADGAGSAVRLRSGALIDGGELASTAEGKLYSDSGANTLHNAILTEGSWLGLNGATGPLKLTGNSFTNDGTLVVNHNRYYDSTLAVNEALQLQGSGEIVLNDDGGDAQLTTGEGVIFTQAADHTIRGYGQVHAAMMNDGSVVADVAAKALELRTNAKTNNALMKAESGGYLDLYGFTLTQSPTAQFSAQGENSHARLRGGVTIIGGTLSSLDGGGLYSDAGANTLQDVTLSSGSWLGLGGSTGPLNLVGDTFTNDGTVVVNYNAYYGFAVNVNSDVTVQGLGEIVLNDDGSDAQLNTTGDATLTNADGHTIRGYGQVNADLLNQGSIIADIDGKWLSLNPTGTGMVSEGRLEAVAGSNLAINNAALFAQIGGETLVNGQLAVNSAPFALEGGLLRGAGTVTGSVNNAAGLVEPGDSAGKLTITGTYEQAEGSELRIEIGGTVQGTDYDYLKVNGTATLAGTLTLILINDFVPTPGQTFTIMTFASHDGEFQVARPALPGVCLDVVTNPTNITVSVQEFLGDVNDDRRIDPLDSGFAMSRFGCSVGEGDPDCDAADANQDGAVDPLDTGFILARFGQCL